MAITVYGSAITSTGKPVQQINQNGTAHGRARKLYSTYTTVTTTFNANSILAIGLFNSNARIGDIKFYTDGGDTNGTIDVGVYRAVLANGGITLTAVDIDIFASAKATGTAILHGAAATTVFTESTSLTDMDRYRQLWDLASVSTSTYTTDPGGLLAICATAGTGIDAANKMAFEIDYIAND
jgi:hypothetical protein